MTRQLGSPVFVAAVALLLLNDWVFKPAFGNWWTGKLSDFAGLFAFAVFWMAFFPRQRRTIVVLTASGFLLWKSPLSTPILDAWNALGFWPLARVIDYTDWIALIALVPAYRFVPDADASGRSWTIAMRRATTTLTTAVAVFAFAATSTSPTYHFVFPTGSEYQVNGVRLTVRAYFLTHDWILDSRSEGRPVDTLSGGGIRLTLRDASPCGTTVSLRDLYTSTEDTDVDSVQTRFETEVIALLQARFPTC